MRKVIFDTMLKHQLLMYYMNKPGKKISRYNSQLKKANKGVELLLISQEAWNGFYWEMEHVKIYAMVGEYNLAIDKLDYLLSIPGELSVSNIKIDPVWKLLFSNPHFQKVLEKYK